MEIDASQRRKNARSPDIGCRSHEFGSLEGAIDFLVWIVRRLAARPWIVRRFRGALAAEQAVAGREEQIDRRSRHLKGTQWPDHLPDPHSPRCRILQAFAVAASWQSSLSLPSRVAVASVPAYVGIVSTRPTTTSPTGARLPAGPSSILLPVPTKADPGYDPGPIRWSSFRKRGRSCGDDSIKIQ